MGYDVQAEVKKDQKAWISLLMMGTIAYCIVMAVCKGAGNLSWGHFVPVPSEDWIRYKFARDVAIMVFAGFGFLMIYLRRYGFSAVGYTLIIGVFTIQQSLLWEQVIYNVDTHAVNRLGMVSWINSLFCAASIMIAFGVVLGKVTPFQITYMAMFQTMLYWVNCYICFHHIGAFDMGGSMVIHAFGAYFGVGMTYMLTPPGAHGHVDRTSTYSSDRLTMLGTLFLWVEYPSFNAALAGEAGITRALMNTAFSLGAAVIGYSIISRWFNPKKKFNIVHLQNACLAGGVAIGSIADFPVSATGAVCIGMLGGMACSLGFIFVDPWITTKLKIQDTCGVHNLHGMPGIMCCFTSAVVVALCRDSTFIQGMLAAEGAASTPKISMEDAGTQAGRQIGAGVLSVAMGLFGGMLCGKLLLLKAPFTGQLPEDECFNDRMFWDLVSYGEDKVRTKRAPDDH